MLLKIEDSTDIDECEIIIRHKNNYDKQVEHLIKYINKYLASIVASKDNASYKTPINSIYYIECVFNKVIYI